MAKCLSEKQLNDYREQGFLSPLNGISAGHTEKIRNEIENFERDTGLSIEVDLTFGSRVRKIKSTSAGTKTPPTLDYNPTRK